jgi:hypothetical protein
MRKIAAGEISAGRTLQYIHACIYIKKSNGQSDYYATGRHVILLFTIMNVIDTNQIAKDRHVQQRR